jgi:hypothetical protein
VNTTVPQTFSPVLSSQHATAIISPFALTIPGKSIAVITVTFSLPMMLDTKRIPVYSGYINTERSNNESFHLPYAGIGSNMKGYFHGISTTRTKLVSDFDETFIVCRAFNSKHFDKKSY